MTRGRLAAVVAFGLAGSQAGHLLAYTLRFGDGALAMQASGAHAYFPILAKTLLGAAALVMLAALLLVGLARLVVGRRIERGSAPSFLSLLAVLYTLQLALFVAQETIEGSSASQLVLWGILGQLPVAAAGALALRWLLARLGPALHRLIARCEAALRQIPLAGPVVLPPALVRVVATRHEVSGSITRRGPPSF